MTVDGARPRLLSGLVYSALAMAAVSSLGMLLVPAVASAMRVSVGTAQWMLTLNLLVGAVATPVMGRLADGPHGKRLLLTALWIVMVGSVVAALAPNFGIFLAGRALQGLTYGIVPVTIALARRHLRGAEADFGIASLSVTVSTGIGVGYPLTGVIAGLVDYRFAFWFAAIFVASTIAVAQRSVPDHEGPTSNTVPFDVPGALLLGVGLGLLLLGIAEAAHWGPLWAISVFSGSAILLAWWILVELRSAHPLVELRSLGIGEVLLANATAIGLAVALYIFLSMVSLVVQAPEAAGYGFGVPLFWAGFIILPLSVGSYVASRLARRLTRVLDMRTLLPLGAATMAAASALVWFTHAELWAIGTGMLLCGVGIGATYAATPVLIARSVPAGHVGSAVGFNQVLRTIGGSCGTALAGAVLAAHAATSGGPTESGVRLAFAIPVLVCALVLAALLLREAVVRGRNPAHN